MLFDSSQGIEYIAKNSIMRKSRLLFYDKSRDLLVEVIPSPGFPGYPCLNAGYENAEIFEFVILRNMTKDERGKTVFGDHLSEFNFTN
jgi:hypothetical protein